MTFAAVVALVALVALALALAAKEGTKFAPTDMHTAVILVTPPSIPIAPTTMKAFMFVAVMHRP